MLQDYLPTLQLVYSQHMVKYVCSCDYEFRSTIFEPLGLEMEVCFAGRLPHLVVTWGNSVLYERSLTVS